MRVWHSGKTAAQKTSDLLCKAFLENDLCVMVELKKLLGPDDPPAEFFNQHLAAPVAARDGTIIIVGHLPHLQVLASMLLTKTEGAPDADIEHDLQVRVLKGLDFTNSGVMRFDIDEDGDWHLNCSMPVRVGRVARV